MYREVEINSRKRRIGVWLQSPIFNLNSRCVYSNQIEVQTIKWPNFFVPTEVLNNEFHRYELKFLIMLSMCRKVKSSPDKTLAEE